MIPGVLQNLLHRGVGHAQYLQVGGSRGKSIGVGEESSLRRLIGMPEECHDFLVTLTPQRVSHGRMAVERLTQIGEPRALDDRQLLEYHASLVEERQDLRGA